MSAVRTSCCRGLVMSAYRTSVMSGMRTLLGTEMVSLLPPGSVVVARAADVLVIERRRRFITRHVLGQRLLVEPVLQDRFDVRVRASARDERALAGSLDAVVRIAAREGLESTTRPQAVLG